MLRTETHAMCHQARPATTEGHAPLSPGHLPYWGCSHKHGTCGHVQNVSPHLAAITYGHETSQINTKHNIPYLDYFTLSHCISL